MERGVIGVFSPIPCHRDAIHPRGRPSNAEQRTERARVSPARYLLFGAIGALDAAIDDVPMDVQYQLERQSFIVDVVVRHVEDDDDDDELDDDALDGAAAADDDEEDDDAVVGTQIDVVVDDDEKTAEPADDKAARRAKRDVRLKKQRDASGWSPPSVIPVRRRTTARRPAASAGQMRHRRTRARILRILQHRRARQTPP